MSHEEARHYTDEQRAELHDVVRRSIAFGLEHGRVAPLVLADYPPPLQADRACFVTLELAGALRGCIGSLQATRPLVCDVNDHAFNAAFRDPRFCPVSQPEASSLEVHISVLSAPEPFPVRDRADLVARLRPYEDGLILSQGHQRATFLPSVWALLPDPDEFVGHLLCKAGFAEDHWSEDMRVERYSTECF